METYPLPDLCDKLDVPFTRVRQWARELRFGVLEDERGKKVVPAAFLDETTTPARLVDNVSGTMTVLVDGGFSLTEACEWMISEHDHLGDTPLNVIRAGGHHRVNRLALMEAF